MADDLSQRFRLRPDRLLSRSLEDGLSAKALSLRAYLLRQRYGAKGAAILAPVDRQPPFKFDPDVEEAVMVAEICGQDGISLSCSLNAVRATRSSLFLELGLSAAYAVSGTPDRQREFPLLKSVSLDFVRLPRKRIVALNRSFDAAAGELRPAPF